VRRIPVQTTEYDTSVLRISIFRHCTTILPLRPQTEDIAVVVGKSRVKGLGIGAPSCL